MRTKHSIGPGRTKLTECRVGAGMRRELRSRADRACMVMCGKACIAELLSLCNSVR